MNVLSLIAVIELGSLIVGSDLQYRNAFFSIVVTELGMVMEVKESQSENMKAGISIMFDGNDIEDSFLHL